MAASQRNREGLDQDSFWYKSGVFYEVHVRAFYDADGDGTGDFRGLTQKLGYIRDLGVTAIWLLPFYPSPLRDDGYDIADYCQVHPLYGTLEDFESCLREAHRHGLRVITELVLNHTSDQHPWFQRARRAPAGSSQRNFYIWSQTGTEFRDANIIFSDVERLNWAWDDVTRAYYWHRFFAHQPDLNYDNPDVHEAMINVVDFWLDMGVDGLRLDAVPYLYEREGTTCENLPETHDFLKKLRAHVDEKYSDRMLLAEANQWPDDAVTYFGQGRGDECHMAFHFPLMPRLFMALRMEDRQPIVDILQQTPPAPETSQWALFLRNHDELTLAMVTEEERDYMFRAFAHVPQARLNLGIRRRLAPLLNNDRKSIELLNAILLSLPGTPVLYYGDEIGLGENIFLSDRNGVRTPMQWSSDKNAGFSRANPQSLYLPVILDPGYHYEANNVEVQLANPHSLLMWMRRLLALRKRWRALGEGKCEFLQSDNHRILCYVLRYQRETLLVVANLSRFTQAVELDLSPFKQMVPVELFGRAQFPEIGDKPYFLSMGPHNFFWFSLEPKFVPAKPSAPATPPAPPRSLTVKNHWRQVFAETRDAGLKDVLPEFLKAQSWFVGKYKTVKSLALKECIPLPMADGPEAVLAFARVDYVDGDSEDYALPLAFATDTAAEWARQHLPARIIAELTVTSQGKTGVLYDAFSSPAFSNALLQLILRGEAPAGDHGKLLAFARPALDDPARAADSLEPSPLPIDQNNSSVLYGQKFILKLFRRLEPGENPEVEVTRFLNAKSFPHAPLQAGVIKYATPRDPSITLAALNVFIPAAKNAWNFTIEALVQYIDRAITWAAQHRPVPASLAEPIALLKSEIPPEAADGIGSYLDSARLLGNGAAKLHLALASDGEDPDFAPQLYTPHSSRGLFQSMRNLAVQNLGLLQKQSKSLPAPLLALTQRLLALEPEVIETYRALYPLRLSAKRLRIHGDFRLAQALWTGTDFCFIDFEGNAMAPLTERRLKRSPLRDVVSMAISFHYAARAGLDQHLERGGIPQENLQRIESWLHFWRLWVCVAFLQSYFQGMAGSGILAERDDDLQRLLRAYWINGLMEELGRALATQNPARLRTPIEGLLPHF